MQEFESWRVKDLEERNKREKALARPSALAPFRLPVTLEEWYSMREAAKIEAKRRAAEKEEEMERKKAKKKAREKEDAKKKKEEKQAKKDKKEQEELERRAKIAEAAAARRERGSGRPDAEAELAKLIKEAKQAEPKQAEPQVPVKDPGMLENGIIVLDEDVELYTHNEVMTKITQQLTKALDLRLVAVHLVDSTLCVDAYRYLSAVFLSMSAMMQLELPHINVLSKIDLVMDHTDDLSFGLDYYAGVSDLSQLMWTLQATRHPMSQKFKEFNRLIAELIEDYGLVSFEPLDIQDKECALRVLGRCDTANGHIMNAEKVEDPSDPVAGVRLFQAGFADTDEFLDEYLERYEEPWLNFLFLPRN
ncbi:unnamed protein product [Effrenium voratum]|uniref:GPN-loop GTPase 2 n=1 Tax=Effrenium voratum TaxID=2562239 RepID=A0AA36IKZ3_9DINO|nr:unnamed protein product [Effrenium voratum]CAJ1413182.1 unnamed protein product [Effrenium voratum]